MFKFFLLIFSGLLASVAVASEPWEPQAVLEGVTNVSWKTSPSEIVSRTNKDTTVVWLGRVQDLVASTNANGETILDFYCLYIPLVNQSPDGLASPIVVKRQTDQLFLVSIRSPKLPLKEAQELSKEMHQIAHYALVSGKPIDVRSHRGKKVVLIGAHKAIFSDKPALKNEQLSK